MTRNNYKRDSISSPPLLCQSDRCLPFAAALGRIETLGRNSARLAKKILSWVIHAKRLLSTTEIRTAVAVEPGQQGLEVGLFPVLRLSDPFVQA